MAIQTDSIDERDFIWDISQLFESMINEGKFMIHDDLINEYSRPPFANDWGFQFMSWLPQIVDICCKFRGYKDTVKEQRVLIAGDPTIAKMNIVAESVKKHEKQIDNQKGG